MNKKYWGLIIPPFLLFLICPAYALVAGDTISYNFEKCDYLSVNITPCEHGEWTAENCIEELTGNFNCDCDDNYRLNLTPAINCAGEFLITLTNYYEGEALAEVIRQFFVSTSSGWVQEGGMCQQDGCEPGYECVLDNGWGKCIKLKEPVSDGGSSEIPEVDIEEIEENVIEGIPELKKEEDYGWLLFAISYTIFSIIILCIFFIIWRYYKKKEKSGVNK